MVERKRSNSSADASLQCSFHNKAVVTEGLAIATGGAICRVRKRKLCRRHKGDQVVQSGYCLYINCCRERLTIVLDSRVAMYRGRQCTPSLGFYCTQNSNLVRCVTLPSWWWTMRRACYFPTCVVAWGNFVFGRDMGWVRWARYGMGPSRLDLRASRKRYLWR